MTGGDERNALGRRRLLGGGLLAGLLAPSLARGQQAPAPSPVAGSPPPVVFVHGNGDSSALWINNLWRFESNGYKREHLFAIDFPYPNALRDNAKPEPFRS